MKDVDFTNSALCGLKLEKLFQRTNKTNAGCWLWQGRKDRWGYGKTQWRDKTFIVHRLIYCLVNGSALPSWLHVCHKCDVKLCINPDHLFVGRQLDNMQDMIKKKRAIWQNENRLDGLIGGPGSTMTSERYALLFFLRDEVSLTKAQIGKILDLDSEAVREIYSGKRFRHFYERRKEFLDLLL